MCNRYTFKKPEAVNISTLTSPFAEDRPKYNICPSDIVPVIACDGAGALQVTRFRWGFIPSYDHSERPEKAPLNARSETVLTLAMFRAATQARRCVMPADGFYEWQKISEKVRIPHYFHFSDDRPFFFASIYNPATEKHPPTCALLTTSPLPTVAPWHDRSPLMLNEAQALDWLNPGEMTNERLAALIASTRWGDELQQHQVTSLVSSTRNRADNPICIAPAEIEPELF